MTAAALPPERVFALGDNFYYHGLLGHAADCGDLPSPPAAIRAQALSVLGPYGFLRDRGIPLTALAGNHDYGCGGAGLVNQLDLDPWLPPDQQWGDRWQLVLGLPQQIMLGTDAVQVIVLDSYRMISDPAFRDDSARILEQLLRVGAGRYPWRVLAAHHPLRTYGTHDSAWWKGSVIKATALLLFPSQLLAAFNVPPFADLNQQAFTWRYAQYRRAIEVAVRRSGVPVTLFLAGHDHQLQLLSPDEPEQPHVLVSGSAAHCSAVGTGARTIFAAPKNGFAVVTVSAESLVVEFVGTTGCTEETPCAAPQEPRPHLLFRQRIPKPAA